MLRHSRGDGNRPVYQYNLDPGGLKTLDVGLPSLLSDLDLCTRASGLRWSSFRSVSILDVPRNRGRALVEFPSQFPSRFTKCVILSCSVFEQSSVIYP